MKSGRSKTLEKSTKNMIFSVCNAPAGYIIAEIGTKLALKVVQVSPKLAQVGPKLALSWP